MKQKNEVSLAAPPAGGPAVRGDGDFSYELASWVDEAVRAAMLSPCKSKRGVVIASANSSLISTGHNHQPFPFQCDGTERCKQNCGKTAIHAEQMAILRALTPLDGAWMIHVKARDGKPCASMAPSCLECSKLILFSGIAWMHLLHDPIAQVLPGAKVVGQIGGFRSDGSYGWLDIRQYSAQHFHWLTAEHHHRIDLVLPQKGPAHAPDGAGASDESEGTQEEQ
jgi:hypothetical protein